MKFPGRRELAEQDPYIAWGQEVTADGGSAGRAGVIDDGLVAWPERVVEARRQWPQARAEDYEKIDRRVYVDRATGIEYRRPPGCPLLSVGTPVNAGIVCFFVDASGELVFLEPAGYDPTVRVHHGPIVQEVIPMTGGESGIL